MEQELPQTTPHSDLEVEPVVRLGTRLVGDELASAEDKNKMYPNAAALFATIKEKAEENPGLFIVTEVEVSDNPEDTIIRMDSPNAEGKPRVVSLGAVHGDEPHGSLALTEDCVELFKLAERLGVALTIVPVVNRRGYDAGTESCPALTDTDQKNVNRGWEYPLVNPPRMISVLNDIIMGKGKPTIFMSFHGDEDTEATEGGYIYSFGRKNKPITQEFLAIIKKHCGIVTEQNKIGDPNDLGKLEPNGEINKHPDRSIEHYVSHECEDAFCVDLPMQALIEVRKACVRDLALEAIKLAGQTPIPA